MNLIGELLLITTMGLASRIIFLLHLTSDFHVHLWHIRRFERNPKLDNYDIPNCLYPGTTGAPPLPHYFFARIPKSWQINVGLLCNIASDIVAALILYTVLKLFPVSDSVILGLPCSPACLGALLYVTTPLLHPLSARLLGMGTRTLGPLLASLYFFCLGLFIYDAAPAVVLVPVMFILSAFIVLSSKFSIQVLAFVSVILSAVLLNLWPIIFFIATLILLCLVPGLNMVQFLRNRVGHFVWYWKAISHETMSENLTTIYRGRWGFFGELKDIFCTKPIRGLWLLFAHVPPAAALIGLPAFVWLCIASFGGGHSMGAIGDYSWGVIISCFVVMGITSFRPWIIWGEAERYLEMAVPFIIVLLMASVPASALSSLWLLLLINIIIIFLTFSLMSAELIIKKLNPSRDESFGGLIEFLESEGGGRNIITTPYKIGHAIDATISVDNRYYFHLYDKHSKMDDMYSYFYSYFMFNLEIDKARTELGADTFILDRAFIGRYRELELFDSLEDVEIIYENERYLVYAF